MTDIFGDYLDVDTIEQAAKDTLARWLPSTLAHQERRKSLPPRTFPVPRNMDLRSDFQLELGEQLPAVILRSAGTVGPPQKDQRGHRKTWRLEVAAINGGKNEDEARLLGSAYLAAITQAFELDRTLGGVVDQVDQVGPDDLAYGTTDSPTLDARSIYGTAFNVTARVVTDPNPVSAPPDDPYEPAPPFPPLLEALITVITEPEELP